MDVLGSGMTAAFLAIVLGLVKVIDWLIKRKPESNGKKPAASDYNGMGKINDRLIEMKGGIDALKDKVHEVAEENREVVKSLADIHTVHVRLGDKVDNLSSKIDKLEKLPVQIERLATAIQDLKK